MRAKDLIEGRKELGSFMVTVDYMPRAVARFNKVGEKKEVKVVVERPPTALNFMIAPGYVPWYLAAHVLRRDNLDAVDGRICLPGAYQDNYYFVAIDDLRAGLSEIGINTVYDL